MDTVRISSVYSIYISDNDGKGGAIYIKIDSGFSGYWINLVITNIVSRVSGGFLYVQDFNS